jgi:cardiolipin synthase
VRKQDIPNVISVLRLFLVPPVVYLVWIDQVAWALVLFVLAGVSDGVDGFLAKRYGWSSRLGGILDPMADKALLVSCFLVLGLKGLIPLWLVVAAIARDLVIVGGALAYSYRVEAVEAAPLPVSKLNTLLQIVLVVLVLAQVAAVPIPAWLIEIAIWTCLATILVSGFQYVWVWGRKARRRARD